MNIVFFTASFHPHVGGVERHVRELSRCLIADGHHVTVFSPRRDSAWPADEAFDGIDIRRYDPPPFRGLGRLMPKLALLKHWRTILNADLLHFHDYGPMWAYGLGIVACLKALGKRTFVTFHGWEGHVPPDPRVVRMRRACERLADGNLCIGHFIARWYGTTPTLVSYGAVHPGLTPHDGNYVLLLGRLAADSGATAYLDGWAQAAPALPDWRLIVAGDGPLRQILERDVEARNLLRVEFRGVVAEPAELIAGASAVLTAGYLGILEAFSCHKPVIATYDNPLKRDYLELLPDSHQMMILAPSAEAISAGLCAIANGTAQMDLDRAQAFAAERSWGRLVRDYYALWGIQAVPEV